MGLLLSSIETIGYLCGPLAFMEIWHISWGGICRIIVSNEPKSSLGGEWYWYVPIFSIWKRLPPHPVLHTLGSVFVNVNVITFYWGKNAKVSSASWPMFQVYNILLSPRDTMSCSRSQFIHLAWRKFYFIYLFSFLSDLICHMEGFYRQPVFVVTVSIKSQ